MNRQSHNLKFFVTTLGLLMIFLSNLANAAKPWGPTFTDLAKAVNTTALVEVDSQAGDEITVKVKDVILGDFEEGKSLTLKFSDDTFGALSVGETKLVTFSFLKKHPTLRDEYIEDPNGPRVLDIRGLSTNAAFDVNPKVVELFGLQKEILTVKDDGALAAFQKKNSELLVSAIKTATDIRTQRLLLPELMLRDDLHSVISEKQANILLKELEKSDRSDELDIMLFTALQKIEATNDKRLAKYSKKLLGQKSEQVNLASYEPGLIVKALESFPAGSKSKDLHVIEKYLNSNSPSIVKQTIKAMDTVDADAAHKILADFELSDSAHRDAKQAVASYLKK